MKDYNYYLLEVLISEREGMIAENMQRQQLGHSMAYVEDSFQINAESISKLIEILRAWKS